MIANIEFLSSDKLQSSSVMEDVCRKTGVTDQQLDQEIPESDITRFALKFPHLLSVQPNILVRGLIEQMVYVRYFVKVT